MNVPKIVVSAIFCLGLFIGSAHATTIGFEAYGPSTINFPNFPSITESGFLLTPNSGQLLIGDNINTPNSGSTALLVNAGSPASFRLASATGEAFSLDSFRAAEGRNIGSGYFPTYGSSGVFVTGNFLAGGSISRSFSFDLIANDNAATDFELFSLTGFNGLSSVEFTAFGGQSGYSFSVDDIVVNGSAPVPEPSTILLLAGGLVGLGLMKKRVKR